MSGIFDTDSSKVDGQIGFTDIESVDLTTADEAAITERTPEVIAQEINAIKNRVRMAALRGCVEIGSRLAEAKQLVPHGEWAEWLHKNVDYSARTAQQLMQVAAEYGTDMDKFGHLSYSQAVTMLGLPESEREKLAEEHADDSIAELKQAVKELKAEKEKLQVRMDELTRNADADAEARREDMKKIDELQNALSGADEAMRDTHAQYLEAVGEAEMLRKQLQRQLDDPEAMPESAKERIKELEAQLSEAESKKDRLEADLRKKTEDTDEEIRKLKKESESWQETSRNATAQLNQAEAEWKEKVRELEARTAASEKPDELQRTRARFEMITDLYMQIKRDLEPQKSEASAKMAAAIAKGFTVMASDMEKVGK